RAAAAGGASTPLPQEPFHAAHHHTGGVQDLARSVNRTVEHLREAAGARAEVGSGPLPAVSVARGAALRVERALAAAVAPAHDRVGSRPPPGTVVDERRGLVADRVTAREQAQREVVVLGGRKVAAGAEALVEAAERLE